MLFYITAFQEYYQQLEIFIDHVHV